MARGLRAVALAAVVPLAGCMGGEPGALGFLASGSEPADAADTWSLGDSMPPT